MAETWISRPELEEVLGREGADLLCRVSGALIMWKDCIAEALATILKGFFLSIGFLCAALLGSCSTSHAAEIQIPRAAHQYRSELTRSARAVWGMDAPIAVFAEGQLWRTVATEHLMVADAQKGALESCLARETQAQTDVQARKAILNSAKPHPRPETETKQVVDDETRKGVAARLNRGL